MRVLLIRHAHAGKRGTHDGDDLDRPLSERGEEQTDELTDRWSSADVTAVYSSRAVRCVDTVAPLADRFGIKLRTKRTLLEGSDPVETLRWIEQLDSDDTVIACSHGENVGGVLALLRERGVVSAEVAERRTKASVWELSVIDGVVKAASYHRAPTR